MRARREAGHAVADDEAVSVRKSFSRNRFLHVTAS